MTEQVKNQAKQNFLDAYDESLKLWPVDYKSYFVETSFGQTHIIESGNEAAKPLILLHGATMSSTMWYPNAEEWSRHYRVYAIDIMGDKNKSVPAKPFAGRSEYADWLNEVMNGLGIEKTDMAALSFGALNAVNFLCYYPERVNRLAIMSPAETFVHFKPDFFGYAFGMVNNPEGVAKFLDWIFEDRYSPEHAIKEQLTAAMMWMEASTSATPKENGFPYVFTDVELAQLKTPMLLLLGEEEVMYNPKEAYERATRLVPGLRAEMIPGGGHLVSMERADYVTDKVLNFLLEQE